MTRSETMRITVVIPLYKPTLDPLEHYSLAYSLQVLRGRPAMAIGPTRLPLDYYREHFPQLGFQPLPDEFFASVVNYNRLLLSPAFYRMFAGSEFMLLLQTDAIVIADELDHWCAQPYDFVGAPWPEGVPVRQSGTRLAALLPAIDRVFVGNGGLSLRRTVACAELLEAHEGELLDYFMRTGSSEDLFFACAGQDSPQFTLPDELTAARFATELRTESYVARTGRLPMGAHAWWKYDQFFWRARLPGLPELDVWPDPE